MSSAPADRLYEALRAYGPALKELSDPRAVRRGIMSAISFDKRPLSSSAASTRAEVRAFQKHPTDLIRTGSPARRATLQTFRQPLSDGGGVVEIQDRE